jgi:hypothetical protein
VSRLWVAKLNISAATARKINGKHALTEREVRQALVCVQGLAGRTDIDQMRGLRWFVEFELARGRFVAVLYPTHHDPDVFNLGSCYRIGD